MTPKPEPGDKILYRVVHTEKYRIGTVITAPESNLQSAVWEIQTEAGELIVRKMWEVQYIHQATS